LISEVIRSNECRRRQALFGELDSLVGLPQSDADFKSYGKNSRVLAAISTWPWVGRAVRLAVVINKLSQLKSQYSLVTKEEMPRLVQQHLDFEHLHKHDALADMTELMWKYSVLDQRLNSVLTGQLPSHVDGLEGLMLRQHTAETEETPKLLQRLSELGDRQHVFETVHLANLLQTLSEINHRQMAADHAKDNLVKVVPIALRKITRDLNDLRAQADIVAKG